MLSQTSSAIERLNGMAVRGPYAPLRRDLRPLWAWTLALTGFAAGFAVGLVGVVKVWVGAPATEYTWWSAAGECVSDVSLTAFLVVVTYGLVWHLCERWVTPRSNGLTRVRRELTIGGVASGAFIGSALVMAVLAKITGSGAPDFPFPSYSPNVAIQLMSCATAGFREEPLFCVLIPLALMASGRSLVFAASVSAALRVSFHLYYGWSALALGLWGFFAVVLAIRTGYVLGMAVAHSLWDVLVALPPVAPSATLWLAGVRIALLLLAFASALTWMRQRRPPEGHTPSEAYT